MLASLGDNPVNIATTTYAILAIIPYAASPIFPEYFSIRILNTKRTIPVDISDIKKESLSIVFFWLYLYQILLFKFIFSFI